MSYFSFDLEQEHIINHILKDIFFNDYDFFYGTKSHFISFETSHNLQFKGVDVVTISGNSYISTDIKAQTKHYINNPTNTFCLELSYLKNNIQKKGWFLDETKVTDYYLFVWITHASPVYKNNIPFIENKSDIKEMHLMYVKREDIKEYLRKMGLTEEKLFKINDYMRKTNTRTLNEGKNGLIKFTKTPRNSFIEEPVNIILTKYQYSLLPNTQFFIYKPDTYGDNLYCLNQKNVTNIFHLQKQEYDYLRQICENPTSLEAG